MKLTSLYNLQAKFKGKIAVSNLQKEAFTSSWFADVFDADTGESRTLDPTGPYLIVIDPKNKKKRGIEILRVRAISQDGSRVEFTDTYRGLSKDDFDDIGGVDLAQSWIVGTEIGIVTDFMNSNFLKDLIGGTRRFENSIDFGADTKHRKKLTFVYTPAFLTGGASPTTVISTWTAVTNGEFTITIDGVARNITGIDFSSGIGHMDQVAQRIQEGIRTITSGQEEVEWTGTRFIIRSGLTTSSSAITTTSTFGGGTGTDISGAGGTDFLDANGGAVTAKNKGFLMSAVVADLTEMNALTGVANGAEVYVTSESLKYDYLGGAWMARDVGTPVGNASNNTSGKVDIATAAEIGANTNIDAVSGATNVIPVSQTVKTSSGAGDENKLPVLNSLGKLASGFIPLDTENLFDIQEFSANGMWTKPTSFTPKFTMVVAYGAGGGGAGGEGNSAGTARSSGTGGGGGARVERIFLSSLLGVTEAVTIGAGGAGGIGVLNNVGTVGTAGGNTSFGSFLTAYGGGAGFCDTTNSASGGGGGGGSAGVGANGSATSSGAGGAPGPYTSDRAQGSNGGAGGFSGVITVGFAENGGGGGGATDTNGNALGGGSSLKGGGGGGEGGGLTAGNNERAGGDGGGQNMYQIGGGGLKGSTNGGAGTAGVTGNFRYGGEGGGGGGSQDSGTGGAGANGGEFGGGGGGGGAGTSTGGAGGAGGKGHVYVISW